MRRRVKALGEPCWMCGLPIDPARKAGDPLSFELDELVPVSKGGDPVDWYNEDADRVRVDDEKREGQGAGRGQEAEQVERDYIGDNG